MRRAYILTSDTYQTDGRLMAVELLTVVTHPDLQTYCPGSLFRGVSGFDTRVA